MLAAASIDPSGAPSMLLPLGISFYSFQIIGLAVDAHRGSEVVRGLSLPRYALFVCFFPQLIAGPILRGGELLPQLARGGVQTPERTRRGAWAARARRRQEDGLRRHLARSLRRPGVRCTRRGQRGVPLGGALLVRLPDLLRLLGLHGHGARQRAAARLRAAGQLPRAVPVAEPGGVLAALASDAVALAARLPVHLAWRQPPWRAAHAAEPLRDDAARRALARCGLDVRRVGRPAWCAARAPPCARRGTPGRGSAARVARPAGRRADVPRSVCGLDLLPRAGFRGGGRVRASARRRWRHRGRSLAATRDRRLVCGAPHGRAFRADARRRLAVTRGGQPPGDAARGARLAVRPSHSSPPARAAVPSSSTSSSDQPDQRGGRQMVSTAAELARSPSVPFAPS